jgi:hypothetical protein
MYIEGYYCPLNRFWLISQNILLCYGSATLMLTAVSVLTVTGQKVTAAR